MPTEGPSASGTQTVAALRERLRIMFIEGDECPRPSGLGRCAAAATAEWAVAARDAVTAKDVGFWKMFGADVKAHCKHPIDELEMLGFLAADSFGPGTLLHNEDANGLGKRIQTRASRADQAVKVADKVQPAGRRSPGEGTG